MKHVLAALVIALSVLCGSSRAQLQPIDICGTLVPGSGCPVVFQDTNSNLWSLSGTFGFGLGSQVRVVGGASACSACLLGSCISVTSMTICPQTIGVKYCLGTTAGGTPCACPSSGFGHGGCRNSQGWGANLNARGNPSVSADTVRLEGAGMPNGPALFFQGTQRVNGGTGVVFGDGVLCAGGTIVRLGVKTSSGGASTYPQSGDLSLVAAGTLVAGDVRDYQVWYRDAAAYCTAATFNTSDAVEITWTP